MAEEERCSVASTAAASYRTSPPTTNGWNPGSHVYPHSHHGTPAQEYTGFNFHQSPPLPIETGSFGTVFPQRSMPQQLQPLIMPEWPSMLTSQSRSSYHSLYHQQHRSPPMPHQPQQQPLHHHHQQQPLSSPPLNLHVIQPSQPTSTASLPTPVSAVTSRSGSTPRKTLTDLDRKKMCVYAEQNPDRKQAEIGAFFGVERSTVSKVLRQREKFLAQEDGSRSPVKRVKGRTPDVDKTLAKWAIKQERSGFTLTDELIREKARYFAKATTTPDGQSTLSSTWLEKFKIKNGLMGTRSRKVSLQLDEGNRGARSGRTRPHVDISPKTSPHVLQSPSENPFQAIQQQGSIKNESPDSYNGFRHPFHSASSTSINTAFTDTAPSSTFSPGPLSPTSPFFTPDSGTAPSPFMGLSGSRPPTTLLPPSSCITTTTMSTTSIRPRSQTFPLLDAFMVTTGETMTPCSITDANTVLDSPMEESTDPMSRNIDEFVGHEPNGLLSSFALSDASSQMPPVENQGYAVSPSQTMRPPPLPAHLAERQTPVSGCETELTTPAHVRMGLSATSNNLTQTPTPDEACRALEVVMAFLQQQASGFVDFQEASSMGKLMEKLKLQSSHQHDHEQHQQQRHSVGE